MPLPVLAGAGILGTTLRAVFASTLGLLILKLLALFGITFVTYQGIDLGVAQIQQLIVNNFSQMPSDVISLIGLSGADTFITLVLSSWVASFTVQGLSGSIRKMVFK